MRVPAHDDLWANVSNEFTRTGFESVQAVEAGWIGRMFLACAAGACAMVWIGMSAETSHAAAPKRAATGGGAGAGDGSQLVAIGPDGHLRYTPDEQGNT